MADDTVQGILEGLKIAESRRQAYLQAQIERERIQAENQRTLEAAKQAQDRLREEQRQFDAQHDLAVKAADLMKRAKKLEFMEQEAALSPSAILERKHAEIQPQLEANLKEIEAQARAAGEQRLKEISASGEQARMTDAANFPREQWLTEFKESNANYRARLAADTNLSEAMLRIRMESTIDTDALMSYYQGIADGTYNQDDIRKMLNPKQAIQLFGAAAKTNVVPLKKQQTDALTDIPMLLQTIRLVNQFINAQPDVGQNVAAVKGAGAWNVITNVPLKGLESQVKSQALIAAQIIAKQPGRALSDQDRKAFDQGQLPRIMDSKINNIKRRDDMMRAIRNMFEAVTYNLNDEQKKLVMENFDLTDIVTGPQTEKSTGIKILKVEPAVQ